MLFEPLDYKTGIAQKFEDLFLRNTIPHKRQETAEGIWYMELDENETPQA